MKKNRTLDDADDAGFSKEMMLLLLLLAYMSACFTAIFSRAVLGCVRSMKKAEKKCYKKLPAIVEHLLCWPMKLTVFCKVANSKCRRSVFILFMYSFIGPIPWGHDGPSVTRCRRRRRRRRGHRCAGGVRRDSSDTW